jgi:hypothetical protein
MAATELSSPENSTAPPRVHAHSARATTGARTVAVGSPAAALSARGPTVDWPTSTSHRRSTSVATNSMMARAA